MSDRRGNLRRLAQAFEHPGPDTGNLDVQRIPTVAVERVEKFRRNYTARELFEMADNAAAGTPPPFSPARLWIERAQLSGDFERAAALVREVKELAPALRRLARAAEKSERRASRAKR